MFLPSKTPGWRISAEIRPIPETGLLGRPTHSNVVPVAGPSNNTPAADCQNRYPSPSKRSDHFPIRPLTFSRPFQRPENHGQGIAHTRRGWKKTFASGRLIGSSCAITKQRKGYRTCKRKSGASHLRVYFSCQPVATHCLNRVSWALAQVLPRQLSWAATPRPVRPSAVRPTCSIARTTQALADRVTVPGAIARFNRKNGRRGVSAAAVCRFTDLAGQATILS